jgi:hypothetical protein
LGMKNLSSMGDDMRNFISQDLTKKITEEINRKFPEIKDFTVKVSKDLKITITGLEENQILQLDHIRKS